MNFITTCDALVTPLPDGEPWALELQRRFRFEPVGCLVSPKAPHVHMARQQQQLVKQKSFGHPLPLAELTEQLEAGHKIIFAALGTMALSDRWSIDLGRASGGNLPFGTTGKQYCQHVWKARRHGSVPLVAVPQAVDQPANAMKVQCGTHGFLAPECLDEKVFCKESDLFAVGAMLYQLLFRTYAFIRKNQVETIIATSIGELPLIPCGRAVGKSDEACELIRRLLNRCPSARPSAEGALQHAWFRDVVPRTKTLWD
eukprot:Skav213739  [mRNA]  locus=scaffold19:74363:83230:- [translate_table: standard]